MPTTVTGAILSGSSLGGRWRNRKIPVRAAGRGASSQSVTADAGPGGCAGAAGVPGAPAGRGGTAGASFGSWGGAAGRGTGFACVPRASRVPSLSIALAP
ncbi:hypothetical protein [Streptomyces sp. enrichment culture]|uniref:hypothetical protein n=1 Tax=Streptomyces sp. enrichment culture TaxID=1795815 RepID=UPI003F57BDCA